MRTTRTDRGAGEAVLRPVHRSDLDALHALCRAIETHDGVPIATPREELAEWFDEPHLDVEADTRLMEEDGELLAWGRIWHRPRGVREERAYLLGGVAPAHRGRGVGSRLLEWQLGRAGARLAERGPGLPRFIRAQAYDFQPTTLRLYARHGMSPVRWLEELLRELSDLTSPDAVPGVEIVPWDVARNEAARLATNDAFADHWGYTPRDAETWAHDLSAFGRRLDLSFMALEGDRVVGTCRNAHFPGDEAVNGRRDGWIDLVGVIRSHRKRGIAAALIQQSLHAFQAAGFTHSALGVDRDNPTGAYTLYERLGYQRVTRSVVYQIEV